MSRPFFPLLLLLAPPLPAAQPVRAELTTVQARPLDRLITLPGELLPFESVVLHARLPAFVDLVLVDKGAVVKKGDPLVTLSAPELALQVAEADSKVRLARSRLAEAGARRHGAQLAYDHLKAAAATEGVVAEADLLQARSQLDAAIAAVDAAQSAVDAALAALAVTRQMEQYLRVTAPFDGVITQRLIHPGALVGPNPNSPLLRLEHTRRLRLDVAVPEAAAAALAPGALVTFTVPAFPSRRFSARLARISRAVDPQSRAMSVELDVDNSTGLLAPGMYPEVSWPLKSTHHVLLVPPSAVVRTTDRTFVVRISRGLAEWVDVRRGVSLPDFVEIIGDLAPGDLLLLRASDEVRPGTPVEPLTR